jgi:hypothetical protein
MKHLWGALAAIGLVIAVPARGADILLKISSRAVDQKTRSVLIEIGGISGQSIDELRMDLPRDSAETAALSLAPKDWKLDRDGRAVRLSGPAAHVPLRLRITLFDLGGLGRSKIRLRLQSKDVLDAEVEIQELPPLNHASSITGFLELPAVVSPGETLEMKILDPGHTPSDGQWVIAGVQGTSEAPDRVRVQLPNDLPAGTPLRVSYFDAWGERIVDSLSQQDVTVVASSAAEAPTPTLQGCARYAFVGQTVCVCGNFPEASRAGIRLDGQPVTIVSASRYSVLVALPASLSPGPHEITGDSAFGFSASDKASFLALLLSGTIDSNALLRGQSTEIRLVILGTAEPITLIVTNLSPGVVSIPGGNYQELTTSGGATNAVAKRVDATGRGNFQIIYSADGTLCPCTVAAGQQPSTASRPQQVFVPRRVLATIAIGTPAAMYATAQAVALANGLAVVDVFPLALTNEALAVFEIVDGVAAPAKALALAADPRVTLAQPDIVYDTSQGQAPAGGEQLMYGPHLIGVDSLQSRSRGDGVLLGIVDTGIDDGHLSLHRNLTEYTDVTGTGWTPDAHGSLVAGIIAADPGSGNGLRGVAPGAKLVAAKSCVSQSSRSAAANCWSSTLARGIDWATQKNARIINLSVGGPDDKLLARMVDAAIKKGIAVVSAAGNDGPSGKPSYPAAFNGVIAVTAVDAASHLYSQDTRGSYVSIAAPGVDILSTGPGGKTQAFTGTSAASAFVSGAAALLLQQRPNLSLLDLRTILQQTATSLGPTSPDQTFGYGLLNVCQAVAKLDNQQTVCR